MAAVGPAAAQEARPLATSTASTPDTVAALHRLFKARRLRRDGITAGLTASLLVCSVISASTTEPASGPGFPSWDDAPNSSPRSSSTSSASAGQANAWTVGAALSMPLIVVNYAIHWQYSRKKEKQAVKAFEAHKLPARLRRQLKPRYFN